MPLVTAMRPDGATFKVSREDAERAGWTVVEKTPPAPPAEPGPVPARPEVAAEAPRPLAGPPVRHVPPKGEKKR